MPWDLVFDRSSKKMEPHKTLVTVTPWDKNLINQDFFIPTYFMSHFKVRMNIRFIKVIINLPIFMSVFINDIHLFSCFSPSFS